MQNPQITTRRDMEFRLSPFQESLLFLKLLAPETDSFNIGRVWNAAGLVDKSLLQLALNKVIQRHWILASKIRYRDGIAYWATVDTGTAQIQSYDLTSLQLEARATTAIRLLEREFARQFDFGQPPLLRLVVVSQSNEAHLLMIVMPHILIDDVGISIFVHELAKTYSSLVSGQPETDYQVTQFTVHTQRQRLACDTGVYDEHISYWRQQLSGAPRLELRGPAEEGGSGAYAGDEACFVLEQAMTDRIKAVCATRKLTPYMVHMAAYALALGHFANQDDFVIGGLVANRIRPDIKTVIGPVVNTLALRPAFKANMTTDAILRHSRSLVLDAFRTCELPFEIVMQRLKSSGDLNRNFRLDAVFDYFSAELAIPDFKGLELMPLPFNRHRSQVALIMKISPGPQSAEVSFRYQSARFSAASVERFFERYTAALSQLCRN